MRHERGTVVSGVCERSFDVVCAGEALWEVARPPRGGPVNSPRFRPGGGALEAAFALARRGLRVGLVTVLTEDSIGRALAAKVSAAGVDMEGVRFAAPGRGLLSVERGWAPHAVAWGEDEVPIAVPETWSAQVLLLAGLSPVIAHAAALCKAARAARRRGSVIVVDVNARWHLWQGRDARIIRMVLQEADAVWCSMEDLFGLNVDAASLRGLLRPEAVLALSDGAGGVSAMGPFGEVTRTPEAGELVTPIGEGSAFTTAICAELARAGGPAADRPEVWSRALRDGHVAAHARVGRRRAAPTFEVP
jgi:sugar/nucleoside kinase (ribokinase family)